MAELITPEAARLYLHADDADDDQTIENAIVDARGWVENHTGLILTRRTVTVHLPSFGCRINTWPIVSVDDVAYLDSAGEPATLSLDTVVPLIARRPACLARKGAGPWPLVFPGSAVAVTMTAGAADVDAVNAISPVLMRAMWLLLAGFFQNRETGGLAGDVDAAARRLCRNHRRWTV